MSLYCYLLAHDFPTLPNALADVEKVVCREFVPATKSDGFLRIPVDVLCNFLEMEELNATEDEVLDACCRWLDAPPSQRPTR